MVTVTAYAATTLEDAAFAGVIAGVPFPSMTNRHPTGPGVEEMRDRFRRFVETDAAWAPLYAGLAARIAEEAPDVLELVTAALPGQRRPLTLFAAVHFLLMGGVEHPLARYYATLTPDPDPGDPFPAFLDLCRSHRDDVAAVISTRRVQTNEVGRSALLLPGLVTAGRALGPEVALVEVGASGGLNLLVDRFRYRYEQPEGPPLHAGVASSPVDVVTALRGPHVPPVAPVPRIADRVGIDLDPADVSDEDQRRWLLACVFGDHPERAVRLRAALDVAASDPPTVHGGDGTDGLPEILDALPAGMPAVVWHSVALAYFPRDDREAFETVLDDAARRRPIACVSFEHVSIVPPVAPARDPALLDGLVLGIRRPGDAGAARPLAVAQPHGAWIEWLDR